MAQKVGRREIYPLVPPPPIFRIYFSRFDAVLHILFQDIFESIEKLIAESKFFGEIRSLNIKSFFNRRCCRCCLNCFCCLSSERLAAFSTICLFGCLTCVLAFVCFALVCFNISLPFIQLLSIVNGTSVSLLLRLLFKFRNVLKHAKSRSSLAQL